MGEVYFFYCRIDTVFMPGCLHVRAGERERERERERESYGQCMHVCHWNLHQSVRERERDSLCVSYTAPGSCYGHILITHSMLDYVLWACNITPSGQSPNRFSVSWSLAGGRKKRNTHIRGLAKTLFSVLQHLWKCELPHDSSSKVCLRRFVCLSTQRSLSRLQWTELQV